MDLKLIFFQNDLIFFTWITITGLCVGSFLNVVIYRLPLIILHQGKYPFPILAETTQLTDVFNLWQPRSFCPSCRKPIPFWANIALFSYAMLRGKSQCCGNTIPVRYFVVELLSGLSSFLLAVHFGPSAQLIWGLVLVWGLLALLFIDLETLLLPDQITLPLLWAGLLANMFTVFTTLHDAVLGVIISYLFFYFLAAIVKIIRKTEGLGRGDAKLIAALGAWFGWQLLPAILFIASLSGSICGAIYILLHKRIWGIKLPFGPFLALAGFTVLLFQHQIAHYPNNIILKDISALLFNG